MEHNDKAKEEVQGDEGVEQGGWKKNNVDQPIKILSSGKVVGNIGEQWKEVRDNRVENGAKQVDINEKTRKEIVPLDNVTSQQVQVTKKLVVLEVEEREKEDNNQLVLVEKSIVSRIPTTNPTATGNGSPRSAGKSLNPGCFWEIIKSNYSCIQANFTGDWASKE